MFYTKLSQLEWNTKRFFPLFLKSVILPSESTFCPTQKYLETLYFFITITITNGPTCDIFTLRMGNSHLATFESKYSYAAISEFFLLTIFSFFVTMRKTLFTNLYDTVDLL